MDSRAQIVPESDPYSPAREHIESVIDWLDAEAQELTHDQVETELSFRGRETLRRLLQGYMDRRAAVEQASPRPKGLPVGSEVRGRERDLETTFGQVEVPRRAIEVPEQDTEFPLDEALNLPADRYSLPLRKVAAEEAAQGAMQGAVDAVHKYTGGHVPKRQVEQLAVRAAQDFDAFFGSNQRPANDTVPAGSLEVLSSDCKGIRMIPSALREATRKTAEVANAAGTEASTGDPMASRGERNHDKRMAAVTANWEQERQPRTADEILRRLDRRAHKQPRKKRVAVLYNKLVRATVKKSLDDAIREMFEEAEQRDPKHQRDWVILIDGDEHQAAYIEAQAEARGVRVTIVRDLLHVLHYLWMAAMAIAHGVLARAHAWVRRQTTRLLTRTIVDVVAGIRQSATLARLTAKEREAVEKCAEYLLAHPSSVDYARFLAEGLPIATGVIEGACRHLVQDRMGITGARWGLESAEAVLRIRALISSGDWEDYWRFHTRQEHNRNYPSAMAA
jgi:hypothetical protein